MFFVFTAPAVDLRHVVTTFSADLTTLTSRFHLISLVYRIGFVLGDYSNCHFKCYLSPLLFSPIMQLYYIPGSQSRISSCIISDEVYIYVVIGNVCIDSNMFQKSSVRPRRWFSPPVLSTVSCPPSPQARMFVNR